MKIEADHDEVVKWSLVSGFTGLILGVMIAATAVFIAGSAACGCCCLAFKKRPRTLI